MGAAAAALGYISIRNLGTDAILPNLVAAESSSVARKLQSACGFGEVHFAKAWCAKAASST